MPTTADRLPRNAPRAAALSPAQKAERAYLAMHRAILEQGIAPGTKLPEDPLCAQFGVSRTLVRAVLSRLAAEGLVVIGNKRTATVAQPSLDEARAVFEARRGLELQVIQLVIERWQPAMGALLEGHVRDEQDAAQDGRVSASARLAGEFHTRLAQLAGNPILERYLTELVSRCSLVLAVYGRPHVWDCACTEHTGLIQALRDRDSTRAAQLMADHLTNVEARALLPRIEPVADLAAVLSRYVGDIESAARATPLRAAAPASTSATSLATSPATSRARRPRKSP